MGKERIQINKVIKPLEPFLKRIQLKYKPLKIILFGSRARGDAFASSDYDILLVSPVFAKQPMYERMVDMYRLQNVPLAIDIICLTPHEFQQKKKSLGIIHKAFREGIVVAG